jgi:hypothetical protein
MPSNALVAAANVGRTWGGDGVEGWQWYLLYPGLQPRALCGDDVLTSNYQDMLSFFGFLQTLNYIDGKG